MKWRLRWVAVISVSLICLLLLGCWIISAEYSRAPIKKVGATYVLYDTYNNHVGTLSLSDAERVYINQNETYEIWKYSDEGATSLLGAVPWRTMSLDTEVAQFAISCSNAETAYLPQNKALETYYFSNTNLRTHDVVHLFFYPEVTLGNGEAYQNILLLMKEY